MEENYLTALACFDDESTAKIKAIKDILCTYGVACDTLPPHVTLGAYVGLAAQDLINWTSHFASRQSPVPIQFNHIGLFDDRVCFIAPRVDEPLLRLHQAFHQQYDDASGEVGFNYTVRSGNWVPHCTLFLGDASRILQVLPVLMETFKPFHGYIDRITVGNFSPLQQLSTSFLTNT